MSTTSASDTGSDNGPREIVLFTGSSATAWIAACVSWCDADGAAVVTASSAENPDARAVTYTTDATAGRVADLQYALGVGPHTETVADGRIHHLTVTDADDCTQWSTLVDELHQLGVAAVRTYPVGPPAHPLGTLQLHWHRAPPPPGVHDPVIAAIATRRPDLIAPLAPPNAGHDSDAMLRTAVDRRPDRGFDHSTVQLALGVMMARHHLTPAAASALLGAQAYSTGTSVTACARTVVDSTTARHTD